MLNLKTASAQVERRIPAANHVSDFSYFSVRRTALPPILAGKAFVDHRRRKGSEHGVLPDFYIVAHAAVTQ